MMPRCTILVLLAVLLLSGNALAQGTGTVYLGDDAGTIDSPELKQQTEKRLPALRIVMLEIRQVVTAKKLANKNQLVTIYQKMEEELYKINTRDKTVLPHKSSIRILSPIERMNLQRCWVDGNCLLSIFKNKGIDLIVASKLSADKESHPLLLVRILDLKTKRTMREFLVTAANADKLADLSQQRLHETLIDLELIEEKDDSMENMASTFDSGPISAIDELSTSEAPPPSEHEKPIGLAIAKWTTLGLGVAALATGTGFAAMAASAEDNAKKANTVPKLNKYNDDASQNALVGNICFGLGGALLLSSVVLFVLDVDSDSWGDGWQVGMAPMEEDGGAIMLRGSF